MTTVEHALSRLRKAGYKITNARRIVLDVLCESGGHLTSSEILERVDQVDPSIGRASVFRTLELLTNLAIVRPTYLEARTPIYVMMSIDGHHAHLICTECNKVIELGDCQVSDIIEEIGRTFNFKLTGHLLEIYGHCPACAESLKE